LSDSVGVLREFGHVCLRILVYSVIYDSG